jgi:competence protein ComFC
VLTSVANGLVRVFLAPPCASCREVLARPLGSPVCDTCWRAVRRLTPPWCAVCGDALSVSTPPDVCPRCRRTPPGFALARSAGYYEGALREIIHAFKYRRVRVLARPLGALLGEASRDVLAGADAIVPVPLHPMRALRRGFNQADDLAVTLGLPVWRVLRRTRHGPPQAALAAGDRYANVRRAFAAGPVFGLLAPWWARRLRNRVVVLVDDVMTTGATLDACSVVLLDAGVRSVRALTVARAVAGRPQPRPGPRHRATVPRR